MISGSELILEVIEVIWRLHNLVKIGAVMWHTEVAKTDHGTEAGEFGLKMKYTEPYRKLRSIQFG